MINWTEEDVKFICNSMIMPAMDQMTKQIEFAHDSHSRVIDKIIDMIDKTTYQQQKEIAFLRTLIEGCLNLDHQKVSKMREDYFKQFDELNKGE